MGNSIFLKAWLVGAMVFSLGASADPALVKTLLARDSRPTVAEIETLLAQSYVPDFMDRSLLQVDLKRPSADFLQFNYPIWFQHLQQNAADFIFDTEVAFPGAKIAFIGRDMETIADLTEAFYRNIGQTNRVVRIAMSRATLVGLTDQNANAYLAQYGIQFVPGRPLPRVVFVDTISAGGGRQGRFLLNALYQSYVGAGGKPKDLIRNLGFIGLLGATAQVRENPLQRIEDHFSNLETIYGRITHPKNYAYGDHFPVLTFRDSRREQYQGFNESGYEHWVGAWHGSYGPLQYTQGQWVATPVQTHDVLHKRAVLNFQIHVVQFARSEGLLEQVRAKAIAMNFDFPNLQMPNPALDELEAAKPQNYTQMIDLLKKIERNFPNARLAQKDFNRFWTTHIQRLNQPMTLATLGTLATKANVADPHLQLALSQLFFDHRGAMDDHLLRGVLKLGLRFSAASARAYGIELLLAQKFGLAQQLLSSHSLELAEADVLTFIAASKSFDSATQGLSEMGRLFGAMICDKAVFTAKTILATGRLSADVAHYREFFRKVLNQLSPTSAALQPILSQDYPLPVTERLKVMYALPSYRGDLKWLATIVQSQGLDDEQVIELLETVLAGLPLPKLDALTRDPLRSILLKQRATVLDERQPFSALRKVYWTPFAGSDRDGRVAYLYQTEVFSNPDFIPAFLQLRRRLVAEKASASEINFLDSLAAERVVSDTKIRGAISAEQWDELLAQTAFGTTWFESFAPWLGPADALVRRVQKLSGRFSMSSRLIDTFLNFDPTIEEFKAFKAAVPSGWQQSYIQAFAEEYLQGRRDEATVFQVLDTLPSLGAIPETIYQVARFPTVIDSLRSIDSANRWLGYFQNDRDEESRAYRAILDWVQTPIEFNQLRRPLSPAVLDRNLTQYLWNWRRNKKSHGWKFKFLESLNPFGSAVDTGARRETPCVKALESAAKDSTPKAS